MYVDPGAFAECGFEGIFHMGGDVVRLDNGGDGVDLDVHIDNKGVAIFASAQMVKGDDAGSLLYLLFDSGFYLFGEGAFE